ncbi:ABC transporter ATP-binding protein [Raineyella fluvialis]|uniref:ATP-binding cassette domain-containing protein n=1 Tax=Raineyella fluvialis TaxID=2662261 RepID=A0A5Q2FDG9_9ACTN|nr:ABC transporter ATP-binding protein [Raineyella fluvialis]QGF23143.1 ATP-binding cassette domain-containing protein [Raineyella fluvialis]
MGTLKIQDVTKKYGDVTAIDHLTIDVRDGEFFVILGPSGAGKTTTLKAVAGLVEIDDGSVEIAGVDMTQVEPYHRNVAMAFESYALYPQKTVAQNLASPLKSGRHAHYSEEERKRRIDDVTTTLGINHLLDRFPKELSNGQRQRTALGRVLVRPASIYLLDEPLSHLDAKLRASMRAELKAIASQSNTTTLYVTHDYQEALALADRIAVLRKGRFVQIGTPEQIWREPVDTFVAKAVGQPEINLAEATVSGGRVRALGGAVEFAAPAELGLTEGQALRIGMRPSELMVNREVAREGWMRVDGRIRLTERLGRDVELDIEVGDGNLIVVERADRAYQEGEEVVLDIHLPNVHLFAGGAEGEDTPRIGSALGRTAAASPQDIEKELGE